ncbi:MAG: dihydroorotase [Planctomycetota bacterium]
MLKIEEHDAVSIRGARIIDPFAGRDEVGDVAVAGGKIVERLPPGARVVEAEGCIVCPGLWDIHVHLRQPGQSHKETIETGAAAAAAGGFTLVACMPNTSPPLDEPDRIRWVTQEADRSGHCAVAPVAAVTRGREGREVVDFAALRSAGAVAFSDDGTGVEDDRVMRAAFDQAARVGAILIQHCEYQTLSAGGVMHLGEVSRRLGFPGLDPRSEEAMIERDLELCRLTGGRYHVAHISTAKAIELVRQAKRRGVPVTAEVCTHHLVLTDEACATADPNTKMHPPLRPPADVRACCGGLLDGTIDAIVTDHAPHTAEEKALGFIKAPAGIIGLETALGLAGRAMVDSGLAGWPDVVRWFTRGPSAVLGVPRRGIRCGEWADLTLFDPSCRWNVDPGRFLSKARNTPFSGQSLLGRSVATIRRRAWRGVA